MVVKFTTFALTIRPAAGVTDQHILDVDKWVRKHARYYHVVTEKEGSARHIHAGLVLYEPKQRSNVTQAMKYIFKHLSPIEQRVMLKGIKVMYNEDFIRKYLDKDDNTVVVASCLPEDGHMEKYFPPKPEPRSSQVTKKCSHYYHELESLWYEHVSPDIQVNTINARNFLCKMMYSVRCIPVIRDDKQIIQTARHLVRWLKKTEEYPLELPPFEQEE